IKLNGPRLLHIVTVKGKGYLPAEKEPVRFHSAAPFDISTAEVRKKEPVSRSYTEVFSSKLMELARKDPKIVAVTAAMPEGTGLDSFRDAFPKRFFDVGIAESHAICFAAGLKRAGFKPVVAIYSTFLQRAFDQIIEDVALQGLNLVLAIDRAGVVGEDGVTHQGTFDLAYLRLIPNLVIMAPKDGPEFQRMLEFALSLDKPVAIRYPRAVCPFTDSLPSGLGLELAKAEVLKEGSDAAIVALGSMVLPSLEAANLLEKEGISCTVINARFLKPLDRDLLNRLSTKFIFSVEEGIASGGFGSALGELLERPVKRLGLPDEFIPHGSRSVLLEKYGLTAEGIAKSIRECLR
ncbi:MAG: 1-deoxy-D-xylulose-5-phosphate synthase, partial [Candidatus Omnitrophica bacterium]|nr:1-deoxy-D-xylulose-5-phosphate synthase [Candidatus Omnitrophota bacterium]